MSRPPDIAPQLTRHRSQPDYIVYVDESGDHGLRSMDPAYPVFVLAFCVLPKQELAEVLVPRMLRLKFTHFGHDRPRHDHRR